MKKYILPPEQLEAVDTNNGQETRTLQPVEGKPYTIVNTGTSGNNVVVEYGSNTVNINDGNSITFLFNGTEWITKNHYGSGGLVIDHEWDGTSLRIQNQDGTWGEYIDLQGIQGKKGEQGDTGESGTFAPWTSGSTYYEDNIVTHNGYSWVAKTTTTAEPSESSPDWLKLTYTESADELPLGTISFWDKSLEARIKPIRSTGLRTDEPTYAVLVDEEASFVSNGVMPNDIIWTDVAPVLGFDGSGDYVELDSPVSFDLVTPWTVEVWFYSNNIADLQNIIGSDTTRSFRYCSVYDSRVSIWDSAGTGWYHGNTILKSQRWYHIAFVYDGIGSGTFYVNGVADGSFSLGSAEAEINFNYIGTLDGTSRFMNGYLSDLRIWSKPLTEFDIRDNKNRRLGGDEYKLNNYFKLDEGMGDQVLDIAGLYTGFLNGDATFSRENNNTFPATVISVDSETQITLDYDPFGIGWSEYTVYQQPDIQPGWVEMDGSVINDPDSPFDGMNVVDVVGEERFIRARKTAGRLQSDAIRNITGETSSNIYTRGSLSASGALSANTVSDRDGSTSGGDYYKNGFSFDASRVVPTAEENRPVNISAIPLLKIKNSTQTKLATYYEIQGGDYKDLQKLGTLEREDRLPVWDESSQTYQHITPHDIENLLTERTDVKIAHFQHRVPSGSASGSVSAGAWRTCPTNYVAHNTIPGCSLDTSTSRFTLPAGKYIFDATRSVFYVNGYATRLWNVTDGMTAIVGEKGYTDIGDGYNTDHVPITGVIEIDHECTFELQLYPQTTRSGDGWGFSTNSYGGEDCVWENVKIIDIESIRGPKGNPPAHEWNGTYVRFENPDGTWGDWQSMQLAPDGTKINLPIGYVYTQYPGEYDPTQMNLAGTWENISNQWPGDFFRVEGGVSALPFNGGQQDDAVIEHTHSPRGDTDKILQGYSDNYRPTTGSYIANSSHRITSFIISSAFSGEALAAYKDGSGWVPQADENRPVNQTIRIWKRIS